VLVQTDTHERLMLLTAAPMPPPGAHREQDPVLEPVFNPVLGRIRILVEGGLRSIMVLHNCVKAHHTPSGAYSPSVALHRGEQCHAVMGLC
jgi:hypothetical protein